MEAHVQPETVPNDRHEDIDGDGDPDLALHRVFRGAEEQLASQVLLDPLKEVPLRMLHFRCTDRRRGGTCAMEDDP